MAKPESPSPEPTHTTITVRVILGRDRLVERTYTIPFSPTHTAAIKKAHDILTSDTFERRITNAALSREFVGSVPWGGGLMNREQALQDIGKTVQRIDTALERAAENPDRFYPAELIDLRGIRDNLSQVLPPEENKKD